MTTSKILKVVNRQLIRRRLPHGLISWRYLLPGQPEYVKIHRQLWLMGRHPSLPLPLYLLLELLLWLRWVCWYCWKQSWELVRHHGAKIKGDTGIAPRVLLWRLLSPGIGHCMPPHEVYCFGLYLPDKAATAWQYVFIQETSTFHSMRSTGLPDTATSQRVIQDKFELAKVLGKHGIPMVPTVALIPRATQFDPSSLIKLSPRLFCKPRHGSAARNNFIIEQTDDMNSPAITAVNNCKRTSISPEDALREAMQHDDFLVQPLLTNHPELAPLSFNGDAITVRIVTENPVSPQSNYAVLEIPAGKSAAGPYFTILPIETGSGIVRPFPEERMSQQIKEQHETSLARIGNQPLPFWKELRTTALEAHRFLPGIYAIAWDYVITPDGPLMLEGNSGWGVNVPQLLLGGLLQEHLKNAHQ